MPESVSLRALTRTDLAGRVPGLSQQYTPNDDFYRIDTTLSPPRVNLDGWVLRVDGMVERPLALDYDGLLGEALVEADERLVCVSNEVGGRLVGNARWLGVPLAHLLARAGVHPEATQVVGRSVDGWTAGFPTSVALDGRAALVAVGMNGEPLPAAHGFPARLVVPGLYGYVSATKWLAELELATWDDFDAYWIVRGWSKEGPIKLQSRIDVPRNRAALRAGRHAIGGVAWAPTRGIAGVEVRIDGGEWRAARLADEVHADTWRQWVYDWDAAPGRHDLSVRAVDGHGAVQTERRRPPQPDGATGHHTVRVTVRDG
jgi:DMSO/TMAO reductase YedYZ molybdopterin-dependent catalytic subunit